MNIYRTCDTCGELFEVDLNIAQEMNLKQEAVDNPNVCYSCILEADSNRKIFMATSFLHSAAVLERIPKAILLNKQERQKLSQEEIRLKEEDALCRKKYTVHFLYATTIELSIKVIWASLKNQIAPYSHNIVSLYNDFPDEQVKEITMMYDLQIPNAKHVISQAKGQIDSLGETVDLRLNLQSLEDMLKSNQQTMTDFKYDGQFNGKSSALCSIMWDDDEVLLLPTPKLTIFPKHLLKYATSVKNARSQKNAE